MGSSESSQQPPVNQNRQSNGNSFRNIDQSTGAAWLQFNWASFGGGISTILVICVLIVALWVALRYNRKANKKARRAELHELLLLSARHHRIYDNNNKDQPPPAIRPSSGYPGMSSVGTPSIPIRERGYEGYPGFLAWQQWQQLQQLQQLQNSSFSGPSSGLPSGIQSSLPAVHQPADWSRIRELPSRTRVSYADIHEPPRSRPRPAAPSVPPPGISAEQPIFDSSTRGVAYPPETVSSLVERLDQLAPQ